MKVKSTVVEAQASGQQSKNLKQIIQQIQQSGSVDGSLLQQLVQVQKAINDIVSGTQNGSISVSGQQGNTQQNSQGGGSSNQGNQQRQQDPAMAKLKKQILHMVKNGPQDIEAIKAMFNTEYGRRSDNRDAEYEKNRFKGDYK